MTGVPTPEEPTNMDYSKRFMRLMDMTLHAKQLIEHAYVT